MTDDTRRAADPVGYRKPPAAGRFAKGRSGNPRGRPKGHRNKNAPYESVLGQMVTVRTDGKVRRLTAAEAFLLHMAQRGLAGDMPAARATIDALEARPGSNAQPQRPPLTEIILALRGTGPRDWATDVACDLAMAVHLDRLRETARTAIEPWLVQMALARLGDRQLDPAQQETVWVGTRTPWKVAWPDWWSYRG